MLQALIKVPAKAKRGDVVEIRALVQHVMETGYRRDEVGKLIPRDIIKEFLCTFNGEEVLRAELQPAIAANPFLTFSMRATQSGTIEFRWTDEKGAVHQESAKIAVS